MKIRYTHFFLISATILILDQYTKYLIKSHLSAFEVVGISPFFNIVYVENTGSAFGMFKNLGNAFFITIAILATIAVTFLIVRDSNNRVSFSLILGGAMGNLADRIVYGYVVDFLDLHAGKYHWPAFNIADSALTVGIVLLLTKSFFAAGRAESVKEVD
jgi:signal peptidase II